MMWECLPNTACRAIEIDLLMAMHEARTEFKFSAQSEEGKEIDPTSLSPDKVSLHLEEMGELDREQLERATEILTPEQLTQFKAHLEQQRSMREMGMKMFATMFGQNADAPTPPAAPEAD